MSVSTDKNFDEKLLKLQSWLKELFGDCEVIPHESSIASGFSNETFVFDVKGKNDLESLVLRLRPTGYQVFPDYDLKMQASIMKLLRSKNLPTPDLIKIPPTLYSTYIINNIVIIINCNWFWKILIFV